MKHLIFILLFIPIILKAQETRLGNLTPMLERGGLTVLAKDWKYKAGDNPDWAKEDFDDSSWETFTDPNLFNKEIQKKVKKANVIWYRKKISIDITVTQNLVALISQSGASEIYLDGKLIHSLGKVSNNPDSVVAYNPYNVPLSFPMEINKEQVLAVRFADVKKKFSLYKENSGLLTIRIQMKNSANDPLFVASDSLFDSNGFINLGNRYGWRFHRGDDPNWARPEFEDSDWMFYKPAGLTNPIPDSLWNGYGWFRYRFDADSSAYEKITQLYFYTWGAAEVYLDGKLVQKCGVFSTNPMAEKLYNPSLKNHFTIILQHSGSHVLAVRYSYHKGKQYKKLLGKNAGTFGFGVGLATDDWNQMFIKAEKKTWQFVYIAGTLLFLIVMLHVSMFVLFPAERSNLYIAIVAFLLFLAIIAGSVSPLFDMDVLQRAFVEVILVIILFMAAFSMIPFTIGSMFNQRPRLAHKILIWLFPFVALVNFILSGLNVNPIVTIVFASAIIFFSIRVLIQAQRNRQKGVWIVAGAFLVFILSTVAWVFYLTFSQNPSNYLDEVLGYGIYASVPLGLTAFMASRFRDLYTHLEDKVNERTRELNQSLKELQSTQIQLIQSEKMASLGQLTAGIAHEIQNPLNFVNNFSEVSQELIAELKEELATGNLQPATELADDVNDNLNKILHHGKRADAIVKGMLLHSRGSSGQKEPTDINLLCDEYLRLSYHGFRAKDKSFNADFKLQADESLPKIEVVPQDIGRVLINLINNAFYAVNEKTKKNINGYKPQVIVSTVAFKPPSGGLGVEIRVQDNGPGIPDSIKDKIFQPFFTTKPTGQGTGLGLSLAYDIVKAHGGELKVQSKEGERTEFIIQLYTNQI